VAFSAPSDTGGFTINTYTVTASDAVTSTVVSAVAHGDKKFTLASAQSILGYGVGDTVVVSKKTSSSTCESAGSYTVTFVDGVTRQLTVSEAVASTATPTDCKIGRAASTASGLTSPLTVNGLRPGVSYTFSATATNTKGTSKASTNSNAIVVDQLPTAPKIVSVSLGYGFALVTTELRAACSGLSSLSATTAAGTTIAASAITQTQGTATTVGGSAAGVVLLFKQSGTVSGQGGGELQQSRNDVFSSTTTASGTLTNVVTSNSGSGSGLVVTLVLGGGTSPGPVTGIIVTTQGSGYYVGDVITLAAGGNAGLSAAIKITLTAADITATFGSASSVTASSQGWGYHVGNTLTVAAASIAGSSAPMTITLGAPHLQNNVQKATVQFDVPSECLDKGAPTILPKEICSLWSYELTTVPPSATVTGSSSPLTISTLTPGTAYQFKVAAKNSISQKGPSTAWDTVTTV